MKRTIVGILAASVVLYLWGFVVWGVGPYRTKIWKQSTDDVALGQAILEHLPTNGIYYLPGFHQGDEAAEALMKQGPVAMIHLTAREGRPLMDPRIMIGGVVLTLAFVSLLAAILAKTAVLTPTFGGKLALVALIGLSATVLADAGEVVWWQTDLHWKLYQGGYNFSTWLVAGVVLIALGPRNAVADAPEK